MDGEPTKPGSVEVDIFGSTFHLRGGVDADADHLRRLATVVDAKMREVGSHTGLVDTAKIAILAALNLAEELLESSGGSGGENDQILEKVAGLTGELENALREDSRSGEPL
jgi:cell division protein ZapA